jgi:hypothetical protein
MRRLEREVLKNANQIVTTSFTTAGEFKQKTSRPVTVITNGFDKSGGTEIKPDESFTIAHIGSLTFRSQSGKPLAGAGRTGR